MQKRTLPLLVLALLFALPGCQQNALGNAEFANTPEGWETFLEKYPDYADAPAIRERIDRLRFQRAKRDKTVAAFREYLSLHPGGLHDGEARAAIDLLEYEASVEEGTLPAYQRYLDDHPGGAYVNKARAAYSRIDYLSKMEVGPGRVERTNMASDPEGPLNGWRLLADVTNRGDKTLRVVELHVDILDGGGQVLKTDRWWAVAPNLTIQAAPPAMRDPLEPGGTRTFNWTIADMDIEREAKGAASYSARLTAVQFEEE